MSSQTLHLEILAHIYVLSNPKSERKSVGSQAMKNLSIRRKQATYSEKNAWIYSTKRINSKNIIQSILFPQLPCIYRAFQQKLIFFS